MLTDCFNIFSLPKLWGQKPTRGIKFGTICPDLQLKIAEKMEYKQFANFAESSKLGRDVGSCVNTKISFDIRDMSIDEETITISTERYSCFWDRKGIPNNARLCVRREIDIQNLRLDTLDYILSSGHFIGRNSSLNSVDSLSDVSPERFTTLLNLFDVNCFSTENFHTTINPVLIQTPRFRELKKVYLAGSVEDSDILALRAPLIKFSYILTSAETVLNTMLKQWYHHERELHSVSYSSYSVNSERLFSDLPTTVLWKKDIHESSSISNIPLLLLGYSPGEYFLLTRGEDKLWIRINRHNGVHAEIVKDEHLMLQKEMGLNLKMSLNASCLYNHSNDHCRIHGRNDFCLCCWCDVRRNHNE